MVGSPSPCRPGPAASLSETLKESSTLQKVPLKSLYEALALALKAIRESGWVKGIAQNFAIHTLVREPPVEHTVEFRVFNKWLEQHGRTLDVARA